MIRMLALALAAAPLIAAARPATPADVPLAPQQFKRAMVDTHNAARAEVGTPPLVWDATLAAAAQVWANTLAEKGSLQHDSGRGSVGENLASGTAGAYTPQQLVGFWVAEKSGFVNNPIPNANTGGAVTGHYTQMVWRATTAVGCAMATGRGNDYLVCRYSPAGNVYGQRAF